MDRRMGDVSHFEIPQLPDLTQIVANSPEMRAARNTAALVEEASKQRAMMADQQRLLVEQQALTTQLIVLLRAAAERDVLAATADDRRYRLNVVIAFLCVALGAVLARFLGV